jgi:hypothetical protein
MKFKLTAIGIATAAGLTLFGGFAAPASAATDVPSTTAVAITDEAPRPACRFHYDRPFVWSQAGIVDDAARTMGLPKAFVCERLDDGRSLLEISLAHGTGEGELKRGILAGQWADLVRRARNTEFTLAQANRYYAELVSHIDVIIRHHS